MARPIVPDRTQRVQVSDDVREVRARFNEARAMGYSAKDASAYANGTADLPARPKSTKPVFDGSGVLKVADVRKRGAIEVVGAQTPQSEPQVPQSEPQSEAEKSITSRPAIPDNWPDLPWPNLRSLASQLAGRYIKNRAEAVSTIEAALTEST